MKKCTVIQTYYRRGLLVEPPVAGGCESLGAPLPAAGQFFVIFWKKKAILISLDHISHVFRAI